jgi:ABC-type transport system substrate-binding protein
MSASLATQASFKRPPEWQDLLLKALAEADPARQKDLAQQLNTMTHDQAMVVVPYVYSRGFLWQKYVVNGDATAQGGECVRKWTIADVWLNK